MSLTLVGLATARPSSWLALSPSFLDAGPTKNTIRYAEMLRTNKEVRNFIVLKSSPPAISPGELAPSESGLELLRLPEGEFIQRGLKTPEVTEDQARAFHSKLWRLHTESQRNAGNHQHKPRACEPDLLSERFSSSREVNAETEVLPFKERIRPGIVVRWTPATDFPMHLSAHNLAVALSPQATVSPRVGDPGRDCVSPGTPNEHAAEESNRTGLNIGAIYAQYSCQGHSQTHTRFSHRYSSDGS
ncbi:hypothetical protein ETB97_010965 [Aspergillus alliaceus]|uniref:Uncharacterized protein n=1 Tax=Petromyces alliaceus TaxID=209559 RepID=A0A8H6AA19_PETAA|nr:hypothetical protein ETB97_010965 [Aspergillus burnettii]